jgi:hypothetical protein
VLRSGHTPGALKKGKANLVGLNEAQQIKAESYRNARGATIDAGGFTLVAANPPTLGDIGMWVLDAVSETEKGERYAAEHFFCDPLDNPHIDIRKLLALKSSMTLHDWETQIRGRMLQLPDRVLYTWDRASTSAPRPTSAASRASSSPRTRATARSGTSSSSSTCRASRGSRPASSTSTAIRARRTDPKRGLLWITTRSRSPRATKRTCATSSSGAATIRDRTLVSSTRRASGSRCSATRSQRPNYKGKGSMDIFKLNGFRTSCRPIAR